MNKQLILKNVRLSFFKVITPEAISGGKPRYSTTLILDPKDPVSGASLKELKAAVKLMEKEEFPGVTITGDNTCLRDGNTMVDDEGNIREAYEGCWYVSANRAEKRGAPLVVDRVLKEILPTSRDFPISGDYANVKVNLFSLNGKNDKKSQDSKAYGKKICCELETVQKVRTGEPLGGGGPASASGMEVVEEDPMFADDDDLG